VIKVLNEAKLIRQLTRLGKESERTVRSGLAKLAFEVRDEVKDEIAGSFDWSSEATKRYVVGAMRVFYETKGSRFRAVIYPLEKAAKLLARYIKPTTLTAADNADLRFQGKIAVPLRSVQRNSRGRVPASMHPHRLVQENKRGQSKGFVTQSGRAIFIRTPGGGTEPAFALETSTKTEKRIDIIATATRAIRNRAGAAFGDAIRRAMERAGLKPGAK